MEKRIELIDSYFRVLNYVTVSLLFLRDNVFLRRKLKSEDIKDLVRGHWGCCPGINYILAHLFNFASSNAIKFQIIFGTGHCSPSVISSLFLGGTLAFADKNYPTTERGLRDLCCDFCENTVIKSELNGNLRGIVISGGELGISIATTFGHCLNNPGKIVFCILGDGEFEAGCNEQALFCNNFLNSSDDAMPVFIVNMNNFKMCSPSLLSLMKEKTKNFFESLSYQYFYCGTNSRDFIKILDKIKSTWGKWKLGIATKIPLVLLDSPKGWTGPDKVGGIQFVNSHNSHKVSVLSTPKKVENHVDIIEQWLRSYNFSPNNFELVKNNAFGIEKLQGNIYGGKKSTNNTLDLNYPEISAFEKYSPMEMVSEYLLRYIRDINSGYIIFSPDEIISNKLWNCVNNLAYRGRDKNGNIIEILNESVCLNMLNGYISSGGNGIFITYEAFAPLISSNISQIYKFYRETAGNRMMKSLNIIITSLGWRNVYTHQNPDIISTFLSKTDNSIIRVHFPVDASRAVSILHEVIDSYGCINLICLSKCVIESKSQIYRDSSILRENFFHVDFGMAESRKIVVIIAVGDIIYERLIEVSRKLAGEINGIIRVIYLENSDILFSTEKLAGLISNGKNVLVYFSGYVNILKGFFSDHYDTRTWQFFGYCDALGTDKDIMKNNGISFEDIKLNIINAIMDDKHGK
ncbi:MAG: hypothetical protein LBP39_02235 [Rickettsiales bacterium]|jgi:xylulose-5-phosphate/fructose-6-phosphate phosphoketolase|nr:hypothetical protein [Rickettsiales bacterium]